GEEGDVNTECGGCDRRHPCREEEEEFGAGHPCEVWPYDEGGLYSDEDIGGAGEAFSAGEIEEAMEDAGEEARHRLYQAQVVERGDDGGYEDRDREDLEGEDESDGAFFWR